MNVQICIPNNVKWHQTYQPKEGIAVNAKKKIWLILENLIFIFFIVLYYLTAIYWNSLFLISKIWSRISNVRGVAA
jgi:hypothetical protein